MDTGEHNITTMGVEHTETCQFARQLLTREDPKALTELTRIIKSAKDTRHILCPHCHEN